TWGQVADEDVGLSQQLGEDRHVTFSGEVESRGLLAVVEPHEVRGHATHSTVVVPGRVPTRGVLDLDDPGTQVSQVAGTQRCTDRLFDGQHRDALKRRAHLA